jgi:glycosyltransferase involved in cell wall biosynthesis
MAAGKPVVTTAVGDLPVVVQDGKSGRVVPAKNSRALADALVEVLSDEEKTINMGKNALQAVDAYSLQTMIAKFEALYRVG